MPSQIDVSFTGAVINVHFYFANHEIGLAKGSGNKWAGKDEMDLSGSEARLELKFIAPRFTDWALTVKVNKKKVFENDGRSDAQKFSLSEVVALPSSK